MLTGQKLECGRGVICDPSRFGRQQSCRLRKQVVRAGVTVPPAWPGRVTVTEADSKRMANQSGPKVDFQISTAGHDFGPGQCMHAQAHASAGYLSNCDASLWDILADIMVSFLNHYMIHLLLFTILCPMARSA